MVQDNCEDSAKPIHLDKHQITSGTMTNGSVL